MSSRGNLAGPNGTDDALELARTVSTVVEAEIRETSRPGSQAPHAPPALTFGRPGKQKVKVARARGFFSRILSALTQIVRYFTGAVYSAYRIMIPQIDHYFFAFLSANTICCCRKSAKPMPWAFSAFG
jgi:hypothetical protein